MEPWSNSRRRGTWGSFLLVVGLLAGCSSEAHRSTSSPTLTPTPWRWIHPTDDDRVLLIDVSQSTKNPHDPCWERSRTHVVFKGGAFSISLWQGPNAESSNVSCAGYAVDGPFYATVNLPRPYNGQPLVDAATGEAHAPRGVIKLANAPKRWR